MFEGSLGQKPGVANLSDNIVIISIAMLKPVTALTSAESSVSICSTSLPAPRHMFGFVGNNIKPYVLIESILLQCHRVSVTYIWPNFIQKVTNSDYVCPPRACTTVIAVLLLVISPSNDACSVVYRNISQ